MANDEIVLGRKNTIDQPSLILVYNKTSDTIKYKVLIQGMNPTNQYLTIKI